MESNSRATIYDIAKHANVSITTVSRVFNMHKSVSKKTRKKVEKAIDELNYIPNAIAKSLVHKSSKTIGLIISDLTNPFFTDVIDGIESILNPNGYTTFLCDTRYSRGREERYITQMLEKRVDGMIIFNVYASDLELVNRVKSIIPIVSVKSIFSQTDGVNASDEDGAFEAVDYLIKCGHRNIAFIVIDYNTSTISGRLKGYLKAHKKNDIGINNDYIFKAQYSTNAGYHLANQVLNKNPEVTAIFAYNDVMAASAYLAIKSRGLKIPDDISIVGYDGLELASLLNPKLTTVSQPLFEMGRSAAELIMKRVKENDRNSVPQVINLPVKLVVRDSVRKMP